MRPPRELPLVEDERPRLQHQPAERRPGSGRRSTSDATAPRLAPSSTRSSAAAAIRQRAPERRQELLHQEPRVRPAPRIFAEPVPRLHQRHDHRRDRALVDQVVEHHRQVGVGDVVVAVVHDDQRIGPRPRRALPAGRPAPRASRRRPRSRPRSPRSVPPARRAAGSTPAARSRASPPPSSPRTDRRPAPGSGGRAPAPRRRPARSRACTRTARRPRPAAAAARGRSRRAARTAAGCRRHGSSAPDAHARPRPARRRSASPARPAETPAPPGRRPPSPPSGRPTASVSSAGCRPRPSNDGQWFCTFILVPLLNLSRARLPAAPASQPVT